MIRLVQLKHPAHGRRVAVVEREKLRLLEGSDSVYRLAADALARGRSLAQNISSRVRPPEALDYDSICSGKPRCSFPCRDD